MGVQPPSQQKQTIEENQIGEDPLQEELGSSARIEHNDVDGSLDLEINIPHKNYYQVDN